MDLVSTQCLGVECFSYIFKIRSLFYPHQQSCRGYARISLSAHLSASCLCCVHLRKHWLEFSNNSQDCSISSIVTVVHMYCISSAFNIVRVMGLGIFLPYRIYKENILCVLLLKNLLLEFIKTLQKCLAQQLIVHNFFFSKCFWILTGLWDF